MNRQLNKGGTGEVYEADPVPNQPAHIRSRLVVIADRDSDGNPSAAELAQFMALPGIELARVAIARCLRTAAIQNTTKQPDGKVANQPILESA